MRGDQVKMNLRMPLPPASCSRSLVNVPVVQDHVQFLLRVMPHDLVEKAQKVDGSPPSHVGQDSATGHFQGGQQGMSAISNVLIGPTARFLGSQRQQGL